MKSVLIIILFFSLIFLPVPSYGNGSVLYGIDFLDDFHGCLSGEKDSIFYTEDGGHNWTSKAHNDGSGIILYTDDGGKNWQTVFRTLRPGK